MAAFHIQVDGVNELRRNLRTLPQRIARKVVSSALREGAKIVAAEARRLAPMDTGQLKRSIKVRVGKYQRDGRVKMLVMTGKGDYKGDEFYGSFVEYGHRIGKRSSGIQKLQAKKSKAKKAFDKELIQARIEKADARREVAARPYMRPAFDNKKDEAGRVIVQRVREGIKFETAKLNARRFAAAHLGGAPV